MPQSRAAAALLMKEQIISKMRMIRTLEASDRGRKLKREERQRRREEVLGPAQEDRASRSASLSQLRRSRRCACHVDAFVGIEHRQGAGGLREADGASSRFQRSSRMHAA